MLDVPGGRAHRRARHRRPRLDPAGLLCSFPTIAGGAFATNKALRDLFVERTVSVDFLMITAAIGAASVGTGRRRHSARLFSPRMRSSTTPWDARSGRYGR